MNVKPLEPAASKGHATSAKTISTKEGPPTSLAWRPSSKIRDRHLVEVCAVFDTLLYDQDGVYDANDSNDRLLLGMKGAMSEYELITLRNRLERGRDNKAARGELFLHVPIGYVKSPSGEVMQEPDEQARGIVQLVFDKFEELGTVWRVFCYLKRNKIQSHFSDAASSESRPCIKKAKPSRRSQNA